jgi:hypothetical protein
LDLAKGVFDITIGFNDTAYDGVLPAMLNTIGNAIYHALGGEDLILTNEQDLASGLKAKSAPFYW